MQNYEQILQELGIEVPEDKKADLKKKMAENYRTKADYDKVVEKRDEAEKSLSDVQAQLDGFKDVNVDDLKGQIATLTTQLAEEKTARAKDAERVEREKTVNEFLASVDEKGERLYQFVNPITEDYHRNALMEELEKDSAKGKSIEDIFTAMITDKDGKQKEGIFVNRAEGNRAYFTTPKNPKNNHHEPKKLSEMTLDERMKLKASDPEYYASLKKGE